MNIRRSILFFLPLALLGALAAQAVPAAYTEGSNYQAVTPQVSTSAAPGHVEVVEFFWYACPHCYAFEPYLENWAAHKPTNVEFDRIPVVKGYQWAQPMAQAFYTEKALGLVDKLHKAIFDEIHLQHHILKNEADFKQFFVAHGVSADDFEKAWNSFGVAIDLKRAAAKQEQYKILGVPTIAVGGEYTATLGNGQGPAELAKIIPFLVHKASGQGQ